MDDSVEDDAVAAVPAAAESKSDSDGPEPTPA